LAVAAAAVTLDASPAHADPTVDQCLDANTKGQVSRREGKFGATRQLLRVCGASTCPSIVRDDCAQRLDELERAQPTIVFHVQDGSGHDLTAVRVSVDGQSLLDRVDGTATAVDPGMHTFTFEVAGQAPVSRQFVLHEGEKTRSEQVVVGAAAPGFAVPPALPASAPASTAQPPVARVPSTTAVASPHEGVSENTTDPNRGRRIGGLVVGGIGVAGLGVGFAFGAIAAAFWSSAKSECNATSCPSATMVKAQSDHDNASSAATIGTIGFVAGGVLAATGIVLYLTAPSKVHDEHARSTLVPTLGLGGAGATLQGSFQ
jgi:hypothetical protein